MNGLRNTRVPSGKSRYDHVEMSLQQRLIGGLEYTVAYTRAWDERADFYLNEFDEQPTWRPSNSSNPHHFMTTVIAELPFGAGKPWLSERGILRALAGGWQASGIYHLQSGRAIDWGNLFYYGTATRTSDPAQRPRPRALVQHRRLRARERAAAGLVPSPRVPAAIRFPARRLHEPARLACSARSRWRGGSTAAGAVRAINAFNNVQWDQPSTEPTNSNFGAVTQQWNTPRWLQVQGRLTF